MCWASSPQDSPSAQTSRFQIGTVAFKVSSPHRPEAFEACRDAIEALKQDVPIWKKEVDPDGGEWIGQRLLHQSG